MRWRYSIGKYEVMFVAYHPYLIDIYNLFIHFFQEQDNESIKDVLSKYKDTPVKLQVFSSKTKQFREVTLTPSAGWGGQGLLGLSIRYCSFKGASENVWHILEVEPNSPAAMAGLQPFSDYVIGTDALLNDVSERFLLI